MKGKLHGNSLDNPNLHHLYEIHDKKENEIFKYGISDDSIEDDGLSKRLRDQLNNMNLVVGWERFEGKILITDIAGRKKAREIEDSYIERYRTKHGRNPRGNPPLGRKPKK
ncbi:MAG: hypothetical protein R3E32_18485 [Chitinophagales bacterium]